MKSIMTADAATGLIAAGLIIALSAAVLYFPEPAPAQTPGHNVPCRPSYACSAHAIAAQPAGMTVLQQPRKEHL